MKCLQSWIVEDKEPVEGEYNRLCVYQEENGTLIVVIKYIDSWTDEVRYARILFEGRSNLIF